MKNIIYLFILFIILYNCKIIKHNTFIYWCLILLSYYLCKKFFKNIYYIIPIYLIIFHTIYILYIKIWNENEKTDNIYNQLSIFQEKKPLNDIKNSDTLDLSEGYFNCNYLNEKKYTKKKYDKIF